MFYYYLISLSEFSLYQDERKWVCEARLVINFVTQMCCQIVIIKAITDRRTKSSYLM